MMKPILSGDKNCYMMKRLSDFIKRRNSCELPDEVIPVL
jgi:hypothetical protein